MKNKHFKYKPVKYIGAALSMLVLLSACSSGSTAGNSSSSETAASENNNAGQTVQLKVWAEEYDFDLMNEMIESFKQEYAGEAEFEITVEANSESETKDNVLNDIHNAADVFTIPDDQLSVMVASGVLEPIPDSDAVSLRNTTESSAAATINGRMYAYPLTADNGYFLYYNKKYFSDSDVQTLDGILAVAKKNKKKFTMELTSGWYMYTFFGNTGLEMGLNDDGVTNYCSWNSTEGDIKGTDVARAMLDITKNSAFESREDGSFVSGVADGSIIAGISGVWNSVDVEKYWGEDCGACKLPTYTCNGKQVQMASFTGYKMVGVNYYSENKEWAYKFADWVTNEENQTLRFVERNQGPSNINAAASDEVMKVPAIKAVIEQSEFGVVQRVGNKFWTPCAEFGAVIAAGNPDNIDLQELLDKLANGISAAITE
ncbi:MAG: extracellular solute-binding protein [Porcipelethomonas sp.]